MEKYTMAMVNGVDTFMEASKARVNLEHEKGEGGTGVSKVGIAHKAA